MNEHGDSTGIEVISAVDPGSRARQQALANPAFASRMWRPGQSGNPTGRSGLFQEMQRRAREATPELIDYLLQIARDSGEDARNRIVAITIMLERGWGKVPTVEPQEMAEAKVEFELSDPTIRQMVFDLIEANRKVAAARRGPEDDELGRPVRGAQTLRRWPRSRRPIGPQRSSGSRK